MLFRIHASVFCNTLILMIIKCLLLKMKNSEKYQNITKKKKKKNHLIPSLGTLSSCVYLANIFFLHINQYLFSV